MKNLAFGGGGCGADAAASPPVALAFAAACFGDAIDGAVLNEYEPTAFASVVVWQ